jgi:hypothetical protein
MKKLTVLPLCLGCVFAGSTSHAIDLKQSKITQVVNDVQIISADSQQQKNASVNDVFSMPDTLRTGIASRAELVAADETVTRVGANTIFSFDPASRTIDLKQGSLLFHSPHGMGGGTIHTGSATASVLGTTLIVTTTPSGGMKVLDLEGSVEVKFLNGLKQNLAPGNMTFVMPGGNQLTPIIVFRLDAVTKNSLLVSGFNQNLASMPLIQQQIDKQLKLIQNGKLTDTGHEVAGEPNGQNIPTIDLNTVQSALDNSFINASALKQDVYVNKSKLTDATPTPPTRILLTQQVLPGNTFFTGQPFEGFFGNNIYINTIGDHPLLLDLSLYAGIPEFDLVAAGNLTLAGSVDFNGLSQSQSIVFSLVAGKQIIVAPGATINADIADFDWESPGALTLDGVTINNHIGNTAFGLGGDFVMQNGAYIQTYGNLSVRTHGNISLSHSTLGADSIIMDSALKKIGIDSTVVNLNSFGIFSSKQTLTVNNSGFYANSGELSFRSSSGSANITGTSFQADNLNVSSGDGILLDGTGQTLNLNSATLTAPNLITVNNAALSGLVSCNMQANTITITGTTFGLNGTYNLATETGTPNVNGPVTPFELNLINDHLGGTAITSAGQIHQTGGPGVGPGIYSYAIPH